RERALRALGSLWRDTPKAVLLNVLRDETMPARWEAVTALGSLAADDLDSEVHDTLVQAVGDGDPHVAAWAIMALRKASLPIPVASLAPLSDSPTSSIRERAGDALGYQRASAAPVILTARLRGSETPAIRRKAAEALGRLAQQDVDMSLEPLKVALRNDDDEPTRRAALDVLLSLGQRTPVDDLLAALDDSDTPLRQHMIEALVSQDQRVPDERWLALLEDADPRVRLSIASALARRHMERCFPVLLDLLDEAGDLRWVVQRAIKGLGMSALAGLRRAREDERPLVREQATVLSNEIVSALQEQAEFAAISPELVVAALGDPEARIRASTLSALAEPRDAREAQLTLAAIGDGAANVRSAALLSLKRRSAEEISDVLAEALTILRDGEAGVRFDALAQSQIAAYIERSTGDGGRLPLPLIAILTDLLQHPYWEVRTRAATALGKVRRGISDVALQRLSLLLRDASRAVAHAADDALAQVLSLEAGVEDSDS